MPDVYVMLTPVGGGSGGFLKLVNKEDMDEVEKEGVVHRLKYKALEAARKRHASFEDLPSATLWWNASQEGLFPGE